MQKRYIPSKNDLALTWMLVFSAALTAAPTSYGLTAGDALAVKGYVDAFQATMATIGDPATRTPVAIMANRQARADAELVIRPFAMQITANPAVIPSQLVELGLTVRDAPSPIPAPTTFPLIGFLTATPLQHKLKVNDSATPTTKAKPSGAIGLEIVRAIGTVAAINPEQCSYVGTYTKFPLVQNFAAGDAGKVATYFGRWITRSGPGGVAQVGPWSSATSANVVG